MPGNVGTASDLNTDMDSASEESRYHKIVGNFLRHVANSSRIFVDRQRKYGWRNIASYGPDGVMVRIGDKISRIRNTSAEFSDESYADSHYDLVNYAIIHLMAVNGEWPSLPPEEERQAIINTIESLKKRLEVIDGSKS